MIPDERTTHNNAVTLPAHVEALVVAPDRDVMVVRELADRRERGEDPSFVWIISGEHDHERR